CHDAKSDSVASSARRRGKECTCLPPRQGPLPGSMRHPDVGTSRSPISLSPCDLSNARRLTFFPVRQTRHAGRPATALTLMDAINSIDLTACQLSPNVEATLEDYETSTPIRLLHSRLRRHEHGAKSPASPACSHLEHSIRLQSH